MTRTLGRQWYPAKVHFRACPVGRFGAAAARGRPSRRRAAAARTARRRPAGRHPLGPSPGRRAAAVLPRARPPAGPLPRSRAGVLRPAAGRGLPRGRRRVGHAGGGGDVARAREAHRRAGPAAAADRLRLRCARPGRIPARGLGVGAARGLPHRGRGGPRLRRPARRPPAARGPVGLRGPGPRCGHRPRAGGGVLGVRPGRRARAPHAGPRGLRPDRAGEPRQRRPGAERVVPGGAADRPGPAPRAGRRQRRGRRRARRLRGAGGRRDACAPVPDRCRAHRRTTPRAGHVGARHRRLRRRGRLRLRVPLRPRPGSVCCRGSRPSGCSRSAR